MRAIPSILLILALAGCATAEVAPPAEPLLHDSLFAPPAQPIRAADVFAVSDEMKRYLTGGFIEKR